MSLLDHGMESDNAPLVVSEYWPTPVNEHATEQPTPVTTSWWEKTNWFRVHEARDQITRRNEAQRAMIGRALHGDEYDEFQANNDRGFSGPHPTSHSVQSHPLIDDTDSAVEYGGLPEDGAQLGSRYLGKASRGIGAALTREPSEKERLKDAPGGAEVFCRFTTSSKSATSSNASVVPPTVAEPSLVTPSPSLLARNSSVTKSVGSSGARTVKSPRRFRLEILQGYDTDVKRRVHEYVLLPLLHPALFQSLGVKPSRGILLSGASGGGKTNLVRGIVQELGSHVYFQHADAAHLLTELQADLSSQRAANPKNLESTVGSQNSGQGLGAPKEEGDDILSKLFATCRKNAPALLFLDEIELIACAKATGEQTLTSKVRALLRLNLDRLSESNSPVLVIGATNKLEQIDTSLLRTGRFDRNIILNKPNEEGRYEILKYCSRTMKMIETNGQKENDLRELAKRTTGFVGSDLANLCMEAGLVCIREHLHRMRDDEATNDEGMESEDENVTPIPLDAVDRQTTENLIITLNHFKVALESVKPSAARSFGTESLQPVRWHEVGGTKEIKNKLIETIEHPLAYPHIFQKYGMEQGSGILMYGPPGCGKTLMARAIATQAKASFISVKGPELLSSYLGESEANIRKLFQQARAASPCVIFFDEIDSIGLRRGVQGSDATCDRILNQLLTEMDGRIMGGGGEEKTTEKPKEKSTKDSTTTTPDEDTKMTDVEPTTVKSDSPLKTSSSTSAKPRTLKNPSVAPRPIIFVVAATNRPDLLDPALLRPGRFDQLLFVGLPNAESRLDILKTLLKQTHAAEDVFQDGWLEELARSERTKQLSGADLSALCNKARKYAMNEFIKKQTSSGLATKGVPIDLTQADCVTRAHIERALSEVYPSVSSEVLEKYRLFNESIQRGGTISTINDVPMDVDGDAAGVTSSTSSASSSSVAGPTKMSTNELNTLRDSFRSEILAKLTAINGNGSGSPLNPQQAMNQILGDLLRETNRDSWQPQPKQQSLSTDSDATMATDDEPISIMSDTSLSFGATPSGTRRTGGREK